MKDSREGKKEAEMKRRRQNMLKREERGTIRKMSSRGYPRIKPSKGRTT
jgi:hypothetical protein